MALNAQRAAEEAQGLIRWLRPEFQNPALKGEQQQTLSLIGDEAEDEQPTRRRPARRRRRRQGSDKRAGKSPSTGPKAAPRRPRPFWPLSAMAAARSPPTNWPSGSPAPARDHRRAVASPRHARPGPPDPRRQVYVLTRRAARWRPAVKMS